MEVRLFIAISALVALSIAAEAAPQKRSTKTPAIATCDARCVRYLTTTFEAQATNTTGATYSAVKCSTTRLRRWATYNVGPRYKGTWGDGQGLIDAQITIRCVPYTGRDPVLVVRDFTFDSRLNIREKTAKMAGGRNLLPGPMPPPAPMNKRQD